MTQRWERFVEMHGLKKIRFHDLRHSCTVMNVYTHCIPAMDQSAADQLDDILFAKALR